MSDNIRDYLNEFQADLIDLINKHGIDNECDTPDFIIAEFLYYTLCHYMISIRKRDGSFET